MKRICYLIGWTLSRAYLTLYHRYRIYNRHHVPRSRGTLIASNHASYIDPMIIGTGLFFPIWYLARTTLFDRNRFFGWMISSVNAIPISRERLDLKTLRHVKELCAGGKTVLMFPEGTRTKDGNLQKGLAGVGLFADKIGVDIVPAYIHGSFAAFPRYRRLPRPVKIHVIFGPPLPIKQWEHIPAGRERYQAIADGLMAAIASLKQELEERL